MEFNVVILAGGSARRLGGLPKPALVVAGVPMIRRVLDAVSDATARIVVGPSDLPVPPDVTVVRERPPGGGPVAAIAAGFEAIQPSRDGRVAVLSGDLPLLTRESVAALRSALSTADGAVYVDGDGRRQWLCGVWRTEALRDRLAGLASTRGSLAGASLRELLTPTRIVDVRADMVEVSPRIVDVPFEVPMPPWFDCDTEDDIRRAEEWLSR